ncbi:flavin reductase family protein [Solwaraspora sp. WMMD937]|uniref:flavin reductase family protein n=1 Tax=Solwaraspora sp. WMMD937 TaxID=3016090 RepID=UPI00249B2171|nr:flavin reductase family protein [Solwaraspora sp. WMMD937]WFE20359.1 flavin reductase family protein [Solwaraspora sp. WMMD937]
MVVDTPIRPARINPFTTERFRHVMGHVPTGVTVVTAMTRQGPVGLTVGSFVSASLDPPLVGFLPARTSSTWPLMVPVGTFCVNVLGEEHEQLCRGFARSGGRKFDGVDWRPAAETGSPVIDGALAWFDCVFERCHPAGDHLFVLGRVRNLDVRAQGRPLVFCHGRYQQLAAPDAAPDPSTGG